MSVITEEQVAREVEELKATRLNRIKNDRRVLMIRRISTNKPFPAGAFEELSRKKIWEAVLKQLDPASLASAHSCCQSFKSISEESLFNDVLSLLKSQGWLYLKRRDKPCTSNWKNNHNIWNLRLVSKSWKHVTEQVYLNEFRDPSWYVDYPHECPHSHPMARSIFSLKRGLDTLHDLGALVCQVVLLSSGVDAEGFQSTLDFLDKYGALIQGVHLQISSHLRSSSERYSVLKNCLIRMPNLKWLIVNAVNKSDTASNNDHDLLRDLIEKCPLPTIHSLTLILFDCVFENELILTEVLRSNPHIKCLQLPANASVITAPLERQMGKLINLEEYHVRFATPESMTQLTSMTRWPWPLKHLKIRIVHGISVDTLLSLIGRFSSTLETLEWNLHPSDVRLRHRLELPNLKCMDFTHFSWHSGTGFDFLLPCRSLEQLHFVDILNDDNCTSSEGSGNVLIDCRNKVEDSNVWKWFPQLACLRLEKSFSYLHMGTPEHYVRKGRDVFKLTPALECEIKCKKYKIV